MGNTHSSSSSKNESTLYVTDNDQHNNDNCMSRSASGAEISEQGLTQLVPIDKLAEILHYKGATKFGVNGIVLEIFISEVFPQYTDLGTRVFRMLHAHSKASTSHLGAVAFRQQCERFLGLMDDAKIIEIYVKMYAQSENAELIDRDGVTRLLFMCYTLAMQHSGNAVLCPAINRTFTSVTKSIFFSHETLSVGYVCRWLEKNLIRLVLLVHKYCVHTLSTAYRGLEQNVPTSGIELQTPVLEKQASCAEPFNGCTSLLPLSQAWLLAGVLPPLYSKPQMLPSPTSSKSATVQTFKDKLSMIPSHWTLLYNSKEHGMGANRFLHHVLGYRGPTLVLLHAEDEQTYCIAASTEWKETHLYTGGEGSCILQLLPKFEVLEKNSNILYLNTITRGYPKGLRAGADPRNPIIVVDEYFEKVDLKGIASCLLSIEVWGCGDKSSRDVQLDIKKWQIREAERQRTVKLTAADWMDHPDRYLLELGGRQNYNN